MRYSKAALEAGSVGPYQDPEHYDRDYQARVDDVAFYLDLARGLGGPVLELGVGTGRVALALARAGIEVVGIDRVKPMLRRAKARLSEEPKEVVERVEFLRGDLRTFNLKRRFPLVISPFNVFMHLFERRDWERALANVQRHLSPKGHFAFDVLIPFANDLARDPSRGYRGSSVTIDGVKYGYREFFDYDPVSQVQVITAEFTSKLHPAKNFVVPLAHRQTYPKELEALLHYNHFKIKERFGSFDRSPMDHESECQIVIARPKKRPD